MPIEITIPRLGWNMEEGIFVGWLKKDGDTVRAGENLFTLEGEKATEDIECLDSGTLRIPPTAPRVGDKVTDAVFRMEEAEGFQESIWSIGATVHESAPRMMAGPDQQMSTNTGEGKKQEPIRNRTAKVGRNDPCPCKSGKKYKNCCMRNLAR